jgi:4'-phosphopantetheinyl transferase EntD
VIRELLPPGTAFAELAIDGEPPSLFPDEELAVVRAVAKRRREFAFGRACARRALGIDVAIAVGQGGAPIWPAGYAGSITHTDDYAAAAVVRSGQIGIDVESLVHAAKIAELSATVAKTAGERALAPALVFSAKESVYKCLYPTAGVFLDFGDVELAFERSSSAGPRSAPEGKRGGEIDAGEFRVLRASGYAPSDVAAIRGRFAISATHVATVATLATFSTSRAPSTSSP